MSTARIAKEGQARYGLDRVEGHERHVRLFRNGANQAVRIPKEFELPGHEALIYREGDRLVLEAIKPRFEKGSPAALLEALEKWAKEGPVDAVFPDIDAGLQPLDDIGLNDEPQ